ncbi:MAG: hypothetical protein Q9160_003548 [Pyrenula sp. 1 TL-2023]
MAKHILDEGSGRAEIDPPKKKKKKIGHSTSRETSALIPAEDAQEEVKYAQAAELTDLPQNSIEEFLKENSIHVTDPLSGPQNENLLRPLISFKYLPQNASGYSVFDGFKAPTPIQSAAWPFLLSERDLVGVAETGSGKTLAFGLPLVVRLGRKKQKHLRSVILTPTRELALQVFEQIRLLAQDRKCHVTCIYGGVSKDDQRKELQKANIVVATPGRLKDFLNEGSLTFKKIKYLVLDEADRMLDKGFEEDIKLLISAMPSSKKRQTAMFTATWPTSIRDLASTFMRNPVRITIGQDRSDGELRANPRISQRVEVISPHEKESRLLSILRTHPSARSPASKILIFALYKKEAIRTERLLHSKGFSVSAIHGDMSQPARLQSLSSFKSGTTRLLVATDVAARGLDIPAVSLVLNLTMSLTAEDYVHRIGRTGRAGATGEAITLFTEHDKALSGGLVNVLKAAGQPVPEELMRFGTTVKKKGHEAYGNFYREMGEGEKKTATKITFDD